MCGIGYHPSSLVGEKNFPTQYAAVCVCEVGVSLRSNLRRQNHCLNIVERYVVPVLFVAINLPLIARLVKLVQVGR